MPYLRKGTCTRRCQENGPYRADDYGSFDSQAFDLGYMNEPYRLKFRSNSLQLNRLEAGRTLAGEGRGEGL